MGFVPRVITAAVPEVAAQVAPVQTRTKHIKECVKGFFVQPLQLVGALKDFGSERSIQYLQSSSRWLASSHRGFFGALNPDWVENVNAQQQEDAALSKNQLTLRISARRTGGFVAAALWYAADSVAGKLAAKSHPFLARCVYVAMVPFSLIARVVDLAIGAIAYVAAILMMFLSFMAFVSYGEEPMLEKAARLCNKVVFKTLRPLALLSDPLMAAAKAIRSDIPCFCGSDEPDNTITAEIGSSQEYDTEYDTGDPDDEGVFRPVGVTGKHSDRGWLID